ncbi:MAG: hypothetical protein ACK5T6_08420 [Pirellula sp.]
MESICRFPSMAQRMPFDVLACTTYVQCAAKLNETIDRLQQFSQIVWQLAQQLQIIDGRTSPGDV